MHGEVIGNITKESVEKSFTVFEAPERQTWAAFKEGYQQTLSVLNAIAHVESIDYILENPELDFLPKETIPRPFDFWGISTQKGSVKRPLYLMRMQPYRELIERVSSRYEKVRVIDPAPFLCDESECFAFKDGNFLYADRDHFSRFGSMYVAQRISNIFVKDF